jgi:hypothetical protein
VTDEHSGSCPTCFRRDADEGSLLCAPCRSKLRAWLADIPDLTNELQGRDRDGLAVDNRVGNVVVRGRYGGVLESVGPLDPVAYHLPGGPLSSGGGKGGPVTGSKERRLPIDVDTVDLLAPARVAGRTLLDEDAVGHASVASVLDFWVEDWRADRRKGERRPEPRVSHLSEWLLTRLDDAMDSSPAIDEFFHDVRRLRGALRAAVGLVDVPDYKHGVPCPRCQSLTLVHHPGGEYVECGSCPAVLTFLEFDDHVRSCWTAQQAHRKATMAKIKALRALLVAMRSAGWRRKTSKTTGEHQWTRDGERLVFAPCPGFDTHSATLYRTGSDARLHLYIADEFLDVPGIPALQKLARAAGLLTAPKRQEVAA